MKHYKFLFTFFIIGSLCISHAFAGGTRVHFENEEISGRSMYGFDTNNDSTDDLIFSTTDPAGFSYVHVILSDPNTGSNFNDFIELSTNNSSDLRVDFVNGTEDEFSLGFSFLPIIEGQQQLNYRVFDSSDILLSSTIHSSQGDVGATDPYNNINYSDSVSFTGIASYALIDAPSSFGLRTFAGTFTPNDIPAPHFPVPVPSAIWLFGSGLIGLIGVKTNNKIRKSLRRDEVC